MYRLGKSGRWCRIQIEDGPVRMQKVLGPGQPAVHFNAGLVSQPSQSGGVGTGYIVYGPLPSLAHMGLGLDPGWGMGRAVLLVEPFPINAIRIASEDQVASVQTLLHEGGYLYVVGDEVALGESQFGPQDLMDIGQVEAALVDLDQILCLYPKSLLWASDSQRETARGGGGRTPDAGVFPGA